MPRTRRHMNFPKTRAVTLLQEGHSQRSVALQLGFSRRAIQNAWNRFEETGRLTRRRGSGRVRATTARENRYVRWSARRERSLQNRFQQATGTRVCDETVRNRAMMEEFTEQNGDSSKPSGGPHGQQGVSKKWQELASLLKSDSSGDEKEVKWWKVEAQVEETDNNETVAQTVPKPDEDWNMPGTSKMSLPPVAEDSEVLPQQSPDETETQQPSLSASKAKKVPASQLLLEVKRMKKRNNRELERERNNCMFAFERVRLRLRDIELQQRDRALELQAQWVQLMRDGLNLLERWLYERS